MSSSWGQEAAFVKAVDRAVSRPTEGRLQEAATIAVADRSAYKIVVKLLDKAHRKADASSQTQLHLLFVTSEIVRLSRSKLGDSDKLAERAIPLVIVLLQAVRAEFQEKSRRILHLWRKEHVYSTSQLESFAEQLGVSLRDSSSRRATGEAQAGPQASTDGPAAASASGAGIGSTANGQQHASYHDQLFDFEQGMGFGGEGHAAGPPPPPPPPPLPPNPPAPSAALKGFAARNRALGSAAPVPPPAPPPLPSDLPPLPPPPPAAPADAEASPENMQLDDDSYDPLSSWRDDEPPAQAGGSNRVPVPPPMPPAAALPPPPPLPAWHQPQYWQAPGAMGSAASAAPPVPPPAPPASAPSSASGSSGGAAAGVQVNALPPPPPPPGAIADTPLPPPPPAPPSADKPLEGRAKKSRWE